MDIDKFNSIIKRQRKLLIKPEEIINNAYKRIGLDDKDASYFCANASKIIVKLREQAWTEY